MAHRTLAFGVFLLCQAVALAAQVERWPEFRGPTGQGHSTERDVPLEWSESRNVLWKRRSRVEDGLLPLLSATAYG